MIHTLTNSTPVHIFSYASNVLNYFMLPPGMHMLVVTIAIAQYYCDKKYIAYNYYNQGHLCCSVMPLSECREINTLTPFTC